MIRLPLKNIQHDFEVEIGDVGVTVRKGSKWADSVDMGLTDVELINCGEPHTGDCTQEKGCVYCGTAQLLGYWYGSLENIPKGLLALEHEKASRTYEGLLYSLKRAYGEFDEKDFFTALIYLRISK